MLPVPGSGCSPRGIIADMERANIVLVTHAGQGFGRAVALAYGRAGYDVVCADINVELAARTAAEIEEHGGQAIPLQVDTSAALDVQTAFHKVHEIFGALAGVVHVTQVDSPSPFSQVREGELSELLSDTLRSSILVIQQAQRFAPGAWVVLIAPHPHPEHPHIAAVGGALARLAAAMPRACSARHEYSEDNNAVQQVRVNLVVPSRGASDPQHDAPLVDAVTLLGGAAGGGIHGAEIHVTLPPPPTVVENLLPEVQAALDDSVRQGEGDGDEDDEGSDEGEGFGELNLAPHHPYGGDEALELVPSAGGRWR